MVEEKINQLEGYLYNLKEKDNVVRNGVYYDSFSTSMKEAQTKNIIAIECLFKNSLKRDSIYGAIKGAYSIRDEKPKIKATIRGELKDNVMEYGSIGLKLVD